MNQYIIIQINIFTLNLISLWTILIIFFKGHNRLLAKLIKMKFTSISKVLGMRDFQYHWIEFCKKSNK